MKRTPAFALGASGIVTENVVSATNLEFEMVFAPVLTALVLGEDK